jgi:hypothetical protein
MHGAADGSKIEPWQTLAGRELDHTSQDARFTPNSDCNVATA